MAKNEIKSYVISRVKSLKKEFDNNNSQGKPNTNVVERVDEVKNFAAKFGVKTKEVEPELQSMGC